MFFPLVQIRHLDGKWDVEVLAQLSGQPHGNHFTLWPLVAVPTFTLLCLIYSLWEVVTIPCLF